jgi:hypothetical protein
MSPAAAAILMFGAVAMGGGAILGLLTKDMASLTVGMQGLGTLAIVLAIGAFLAQRSKLKTWVAASSAAEREAKMKANADRPKCRRCGLAIVGAEQPWQKESYCSRKCQELGSKGP